MRLSGSLQHSPESYIKHPIAKVRIDYKLPNELVNRASNFAVPYNYQPYHELRPCYRFAASVAMFGSLLKESDYSRQMRWNETLMAANEAYDRNDPVQKEFIQIVEKAKKIYGKGRRKRLVN
jgi:Ca-activated chloride channel family protein